MFVGLGWFGFFCLSFLCVFSFFLRSLKHLRNKLRLLYQFCGSFVVRVFGGLGRRTLA